MNVRACVQLCVPRKTHRSTHPINNRTRAPIHATHVHTRLPNANVHHNPCSRRYTETRMLRHGVLAHTRGQPTCNACARTYARTYERAYIRAYVRPYVPALSYTYTRAFDARHLTHEYAHLCLRLYAFRGRVWQKASTALKSSKDPVIFMSSSLS